MTEGIVRIYMAVVEPEDKNLLWLRPFLDKEGYELLYYGSKGWTKLCLCKQDNGNIEDSDKDDEPCGCPETE